VTETEPNSTTKLVAWFVMLSASLLNFLNFNEYPLFRGEVAIVLGGLLLVAAALTGLERAAPRLAFVFTSILVGFGVDLNMAPSIWPLIVGIAALSIAGFHNAAVVKVATAAFGAVLLFQLAMGVTGPRTAALNARSTVVPETASQAPVVHLLLDSYMGLDGMGADPAYAELRTETAEFYRRHGFRVYQGAYSRHANTANSVPYLLSFGTAAPAKVTQLDERLLPGRFDYFVHLSSQGYAVSVRGANYLDLCADQPVRDCQQYTYSGLAALTKFPMSTVDRARMLGITLASMSPVTTNLVTVTELAIWKLGLTYPRGMRNMMKTSTPKAALSLIDLRRELASPEHGRVYFAHLLVPHEPYAFDENCHVKPPSLWHTEESGAKKSVRIADYLAQTRCMHRLLGQVFDTLRQSPAGRDAVVIVHGDHGSRITDSRPTSERPNAGGRDYAMTYSTMFAIRAPGVPPGLVEGRASLDELLEDFTASGFSTAPSAGVRPAEVILATWDWIPQRRVPLPQYPTD